MKSMNGLGERISALLESEKPSLAHGLPLLMSKGLDQLPLPGGGATLQRWQALAAVAAWDLSLAKLYEGHTDALAILQELAPQRLPVKSGKWCVWAAEAPGGRTLLECLPDGAARLTGAKYWCSGAVDGDYALLTAWDANASGPYLVAVPLDQPTIRVEGGAWKAVGMAGSRSVNVFFDQAQGYIVGAEKQYLSRPGFWHGGAGVAACWYGGALGLASALRHALKNSKAPDSEPYKLASLGKVDLALNETAAVLREAAAWIDAHPLQDASRWALATRLSAERSAKLVLEEVGKALGATPFCLNAQFAQAAADLPVFIRQSHGERDFFALGQRCLQAPPSSWAL